MRIIKYFIVLLAIICNIQGGLSQEICGMGQEFQGCVVDDYLVDTTCSEYSRRHFISLKFHNVCKNEGSGCLDPALILKGIQSLNKYFNPAGIYFETDINSTALNNTTIFNNQSLQLFEPYLSNLDPQQLNMFCQRIDSSSGNGAAVNVPSNGFRVRGNFGLKSVYESTIIAHEAGHCLGLPHIFGCSNMGGPDTLYFKKELCNGSNCGQSGDMICDTPPDNGDTFNVDTTSCKYTSGLPCAGDSLGAIKNIMGYHHDVCKTEFTRQQYLAMKCALDIREELQDMQRERSIQYITGNDTFASNLLIYDDIIIQNGGELTITDTLRMPSYGSIIVKNGGKLTVVGGTITSFITGSYWQGIIVEGTGQTSGNGWLVLDGATLEHARLAVYSENGGRVNAENSNFKNNKKSVLISQYRRPVPNKITNCIFITDEELFDVAWHVPLWDSTVMELKGEQNFQPDHDYFIQVESSNLITVTGSDFISTASLDQNRYGTGINLIDADMTISNCHFENQRFGISKHNTWPGGKGITSVRQNNFENCRWSILLDGGDFTRIVGNTFQLPEDIDTFQIAAGIVNDGSNAVQIKDGNSFAASDANNSFFIYSNKLVDQHASEITRNTFGRADSSSWRQVELQGAQYSLQIFCNNFSLSAGTDFAVGLETGTTLMDQGTTDMPAGNDWNTLGDCPSMSNDESHIYSDGSNDSLGYFAFSDKLPDCISPNVVNNSAGSEQPFGYCDPTILCPPPSIPCGIVLLDSVILVIDTLERNPPWGMSQSEIDRNIGFAQHTKNIIVQDILIDLLEQDSIELALEWLDSVAVRTSAYDSLKILMNDRYDEQLLKPGGAIPSKIIQGIQIVEAITDPAMPTSTIKPLVIQKSNADNIEDNLEVYAKAFQFFPNPTYGEITIRLNSSLRLEKWSYRVFDVHGRIKVASTVLSGKEEIIDVSHIPTGVYLIEIYTENLLLGVERLIKLD